MTLDTLMIIVFVGLAAISGLYLWVDNNTFIFSRTGRRSNRYVRYSKNKRHNSR